MNVTYPASSPLYKPAVYAELCKRADIRLFVSLQRDIELSAGCMTFSSGLASYFGIFISKNRSYLGIPSVLWDYFEQIDIQSFSVTPNYLNLHFDVDEELNSNQRTAFGVESTVSFGARELTIRIPAQMSVTSQLSSSIVLTLCRMDEFQRSDQGSDSMIPITRKQVISDDH